MGLYGTVVSTLSLKGLVPEGRCLVGVDVMMTSLMMFDSCLAMAAAKSLLAIASSSSALILLIPSACISQLK